jgi:UDP-N-acetylglucosamine 4-epimerase
LPKSEGAIGRPLSPYAASKQMNEIYAGVFARCYGMETVGLRYFNVFGPRQDPQGAYAAVIPRWVRAALTGEPVEINGDGETTRDFCYVANVVQANLHAALTDNAQALGRVYNIAVGESTSLNALLELICSLLGEPAIERIHRPFRAGDVRHSRADIALARQLLDYRPSHALANGLREALPWYVTRFAAPATAD